MLQFVRNGLPTLYLLKLVFPSNLYFSFEKNPNLKLGSRFNHRPDTSFQLISLPHYFEYGKSWPTNICNLSKH